MEKQKVFIGVDIGINGGIVVINENGLINAHTIPVLGDKILDIELFKIFEQYAEYEMFICLEEVHSIFGVSAKSNFSFGTTFGKKLMISAVSNYLYGAVSELVAPKKWQAEVWASSDKIYKAAKKVDTKKTSLMAAKRLFPSQTFLATTRSRVPHDGLVDAALIAFYCKLRFGKN